MKTLLVVLDGAADRPSPLLKGRTPLEAARTPNLDRLAGSGILGRVRTAPRGIAPESDGAVLALLGYPTKAHTGRGPLEAKGLGYRPRKKYFLALRANFATTRNGKKIVDRRAGRTLTSRESKALAGALNKGLAFPLPFRVLPGLAHRAVVVFESEKPLSARISNTDPAYRTTRGGVATAVRHYKPYVSECKPLQNTQAARQTALLVNLFTKRAYELLTKNKTNKKRRNRGELPANTLLLRDAGVRFPSLKPKKGWAILADMPLEVGIGRLAGMNVLPVRTPTFTLHEYRERAARVLGALENHRGIYVHLKGPDLFGHDGDAKGKVKSLEEIDRGFFAPLLRGLDLSNVRVIVTADHSTPCAFKAHGSDPVPFLVAGSGIRETEEKRFTEREARKGKGGLFVAQLLLQRWG